MAATSRKRRVHGGSYCRLMTDGESWASTLAARAVMRGNRGRDTRPELAVRRILHRHGLRYRVHLRVPEVPRRSIDIAFPRQRVAVFVDGCFWHGCPEHYRPATTHREFWASKIADNQSRDKDTTRRLEVAGWRVLRFWEHDDPLVVATAVEAQIRGSLRRPVHVHPSRGDHTPG